MTFSDYNSHSAPLFLTLKILAFTKIDRIGMQMYKYYNCFFLGQNYRYFCI